MDKARSLGCVGWVMNTAQVGGIRRFAAAAAALPCCGWLQLQSLLFSNFVMAPHLPPSAAPAPAGQRQGNCSRFARGGGANEGGRERWGRQGKGRWTSQLRASTGRRAACDAAPLATAGLATFCARPSPLPALAQLWLSTTGSPRSAIERCDFSGERQLECELALACACQAAAMRCCRRRRLWGSQRWLPACCRRCSANWLHRG